MKARVVPYSGIVGSSVELYETEGGPVVVQLALLNVIGIHADHKRMSEMLAREVAAAINARGTRFAVSTLVPS